MDNNTETIRWALEQQRGKQGTWKDAGLSKEGYPSQQFHPDEEANAKIDAALASLDQPAGGWQPVASDFEDEVSDPNGRSELWIADDTLTVSYTSFEEGVVGGELSWDMGPNFRYCQWTPAEATPTVPVEAIESVLFNTVERDSLNKDEWLELMQAKDAVLKWLNATKGD